ncbi:putative glycerol-1-phosphate prenyltransferase [Bacillus oleivorans]|uniref:Heptaprenylglyceryl phosphate synthase n=1 Tax=Bacillus oleivorans TaxID=1448271 RepID=A0A285CV92_9BACI|nr:heptaprenylglyceryl phosphate synthase [Bacillus oleivorans]SNX70958.1 putative glycerol-1-phosphate prenyltransferase [Bacillus oleivorans]
MYNIREWRHVFKLDPNKEINDEQLESICESGTDAVLVGGTDGVTLENTLDLLARIRKFLVPCVLEISNLESITPGFDFFFVPTVLNSTNPKWMIDLHREAVKNYGEFINWDEMMVEGYCMLNPDSKAFQATESKLIHDEDVLAYATIAEKMFHLPIFYLEYSGIYGDPALVGQVYQKLEKTVLFYGGGIENADQAKQMAERADVIVVGNLIYEDTNTALQTVAAVKDCKKLKKSKAFN